jgi:hypothetical protein
MPTDNILARIREFFGYPSLSAFGKDWRALTDEDKDQIKKGIEDGSLNY